jgi:2-haloacid dehalogenase
VRNRRGCGRSSSDDLGRDVRVYGTLVQFHEAVEQVLAEIINDLGIDVSVPRLRAEFRATQGPLQQQGAWSPYKDVLKRGLKMTLEHRGLPYRSEYGERLVTMIADARPFSDVPAALAVLQPHARLIFISNTDRDMIVRNLSHLTITPDLVVTAEEAKMYKPAHGIFRYAWARARVRPAETVHVAAGFHHDIEPAHALGVRRVWVNRRGERGDQRFGPYEELRDLQGLPSVLGL